MFRRIPRKSFSDTLERLSFLRMAARLISVDRKIHSTGSSGETLSDSNERGSKGFVSTLELKGKFNVEMKLDWIFVKPLATHRSGRSRPTVCICATVWTDVESAELQFEGSDLRSQSVNCRSAAEGKSTDYSD